MRTRKSDITGLTLPSRFTSEVYKALSRTPLATPAREYEITTGLAATGGFVWYRVPKVGSRSIYHALHALAKLRDTVEPNSSTS